MLCVVQSLMSAIRQAWMLSDEIMPFAPCLVDFFPRRLAGWDHRIGFRRMETKLKVNASLATSLRLHHDVQSQDL
jgi:hypothetical protein